jgi:hypothetical protein
VEVGVALGVLLEDLADDGDGVGVDAQDDGRERLALLENEAVVAQRVCCLEEGLDALRLGI